MNHVLDELAHPLDTIPQPDVEYLKELLTIALGHILLRAARAYRLGRGAPDERSSKSARHPFLPRPHVELLWKDAPLLHYFGWGSMSAQAIRCMVSGPVAGVSLPGVPILNGILHRLVVPRVGASIRRHCIAKVAT